MTPTGVVAPVVKALRGGRYRVRTPCGGVADVPAAAVITAAAVVLDPGHGGAETGEVGANGLAEKDLNLEVAIAAARRLEEGGLTAVLTRTADHDATVATRAEVASALGPMAFVSIHHNGGADSPSERPGCETYFQEASAESRRLAGLLHEELLAAFTPHHGVRWHANRDAGAKYRRNHWGGDYYGILRLSAGVPAAISEALFLSNPEEAELLAQPAVREAEAAAIAAAVTRFLATTDPGSGYVEPEPRTTPGSPSVMAEACVDPPLV